MAILIDTPSDITRFRRLREAIVHPSPSLIRQIQESIQDTDEVGVSIAYHRLVSCHRIARPPEPPCLQPSVTPVMEIDEGPFTGKAISDLRFGQWICHATGWNDAVQFVYEILLIEHPDTFDRIATSIMGSHRRYISTNPDDLQLPRRLLGSQYFVAGNLSANNAVRLIKKLAEVFGYDKPEIDPSAVS